MSEVNKKIIPLEVRGEYILGSGVTIGAQGSFDSVYLRIKFDDKWLGLTKYATWENAHGVKGAQDPITALDLAPGEPDTYDIPVPQFATEYAGTVRLALSGYVIGGTAGREIESLLNTVSGAFKVLESGAVRLDGGGLSSTLADKLLADLDKAEKEVLNAIDDMEQGFDALQNHANKEFETAKTAANNALNAATEALGDVKAAKADVDAVAKAATDALQDVNAEHEEFEDNVRKYIDKVIASRPEFANALIKGLNDVIAEQEAYIISGGNND